MDSLFDDFPIEANSKWKVANFSADDVCEQSARQEIENRYWDITEVTNRFNRKSVSFQLSKTDCLHRWLKYKEGFSATLVKELLTDFKIKAGDLVLDPFMGSGTTALVSILNGFNAVGFDIMPMSEVAIKAKSSVNEYDVAELDRLLAEVESLEVPANYTVKTPEVSITRGAYPEDTTIALAYYKEYFSASSYSPIAKNLLELCTLNSLEDISYSSKDGQYLRWDKRCIRIVEAIEAREKAGRAPFKKLLDKGQLSTLKERLTQELTAVISDIKHLKTAKVNSDIAVSDFTQGSSLFELPKMAANTVSAVVTSPPYCNRYDYTRTYALELVYLGVGEEALKQMRQDLLSCTVENKPKIELLREYYHSLDRDADFDKIYNIIKNNKALQECIKALVQRNDNGEINNKGVLKMVEGYFSDLTFLFAELLRVCKEGAMVAFVNDNVRYAGEVIPVDFLTTNLAEELGFEPVKIYTLQQQKGNSSQQMKTYGRVALRKSITIWRKPIKQ